MTDHKAMTTEVHGRARGGSQLMRMLAVVLPTGTATVAAWADTVPSPVQVSLAESVQSPVLWSPGEAGVMISLVSGDAIQSTVDYSVPGRSLSFTMDRTYRSGNLGHGPLGSGEWTSRPFSRLQGGGSRIYFQELTRFGRFLKGGTMLSSNLASALRESSSLLHRVKAPFWANRVDKLLRECGRGPSSIGREILSWYGGMGSFGDFQISALNGHIVSEQEESALNDRLDELRESIFEEASRLVRER